MKCIQNIELRDIEVKNDAKCTEVTGKVYMDNKCIGTILNDGWGDETYIEFKNETENKEFMSTLKKYYKKNKLTLNDIEQFLRKLLKLNNIYLDEKKENKKVYQLMFFK
ncbi:MULTISPECIES: hypothetical protein [Clostridium]|jgi:hypothetical protein|uniref:hypothetical protein n=1 Tax=Clostridium TaxID=1485 RepID=UPI00242EF4B7|nr:hypothetical protein [Clostridium tyrobutyricum]